MSAIWAPSSTRATSLTRTTEPSGLARTMMSSKASASLSRPWVVMVSWNCWSAASGAAPIRPTAAWMFWLWIAAATSEGVRSRLVSLFGSSQIRML